MAVINFLTMNLYSGIVRRDLQFVSIEKSLKKGSAQGIKIKALDLMQDLVLTNHIFCDKTGTLTKNKLIFRNLLFEGNNFSAEISLEDFKNQIDNSSFQNSEKIQNLWRCICLCHDVTPVNGQLHGTSQDEVEFLEMVKFTRYADFQNRDQNMVTITVGGIEEKYEILKVVEFISER